MTTEQTLLRDSLFRLIDETYTFDHRRSVLVSERGADPECWGSLAEMGVLGLLVAEDHGGLGGGPVEAMLLMQGVGHGLLLEPVLATAVIGATLIGRLGTADQQAEYLPRVVAGEIRLAFADDESPAFAVTASEQESGFRFDGSRVVVEHAGLADVLLVSARTETGEAAVFLVPTRSEGLGISAYRTIDGPRAADLEFQGVKLPASSRLGGDAQTALHEVRRLGAFAVCAEAVEVMLRVNAITLDYLKTRQQFGQAIGRFQALQHRIVDMTLEAEQARALVLRAASALMSSEPLTADRAVSAAKVQVCKAARQIAQQAIQLHGGMGMMNEVAISHYAKRLNLIETQFGDRETHLDRYAKLAFDSAL